MGLVFMGQRFLFLELEKGLKTLFYETGYFL